MDKHEFNNFIYTKNQNSKRVLVEHNNPIPESLYKFYAINHNNIDAIINNYFYAAHPFDLNDVFDSNPGLLYASKPLGFKEYKNFIGFTFDDIEKLKSFYNNDIKEERICGSYISLFWHALSNKFGVISMTEKENNNLMWTHYTQEKGFQIKFEKNILEKSIQNNLYNDSTNSEYLGLIPINYSDQLIPIDITEFPDFWIPVYYMANIKSLEWNYEKEWRFFISKENMGVPSYKKPFSNEEKSQTLNRNVYYNCEAIEQVLFGNKFFNGLDFRTLYINKNDFKVELIRNSINFNNLQKLLKYIFENLKDKLFLCTANFKLNESKNLYLNRTKERYEISIFDELTFIFKRTGEIYNLEANK